MGSTEGGGDPGPLSAAAMRLPVPPRQSQVDADNLDEGLVGILAERVERAMGNFTAGASHAFKPEISLLLKLAIFRFGIYDPLRRSSPGANLQNLRLASTSGSHDPTRRKLLLYLLLHPPIFPSYILSRLRIHALSNQWPDLPPRDWRLKAWKAIGWMETCAKAWELAGWGAFLVDPRYPSLLMRILRLQLVPSSAKLTRLVSYEFMNRQLVWSAFTEFLIFAVPRLPPLPSFLHPAALIAPIRALVTPPQLVDYDSIPLVPRQNSDTPASREAHGGLLAKLPLDSCPICHLRRVSVPKPIADGSTGAAISLPPVEVDEGQEEERIFVPAQTDCWGGCKWCYYCIAGELASHSKRIAKVAGQGKEEANLKWSCLRCGGGATRAWRVGPAAEEQQEEEEGSLQSDEEE